LSKASGGDGTALSPLPDTETELRDSARYFQNAKLLVRGDATKATLNSELLGSYRILSFATHGLSTVDEQGLPDPALVLTPVTAGDPGDNGLLTASEIADLDLSASFVALSACNTATLDSARLSEDLPALSSAFAQAGVPSTLATLWSVDSETTRRIVTGTFGEISAHPERGSAEDLANAQRAFLSKPPSLAFLHPRFWAAFVVLGDGNAPLSSQALPPGLGPRQATLTSMDVVVEHGGEVLGLQRSEAGVVTSFISEPDAAGHHGAGARWSSTGGVSWVQVNTSAGASRFVVRSGAQVLAGGLQTTAYGHWHAVLDKYDARSGTDLGTWQDADDPKSNGFVISGASVSADESIFLVAHAPLNLYESPGAAKLTALAVSGREEPRLLFETRPPNGYSVDSATIASVGSHVVVTYTDRYSSHTAPTLPEDDYDAVICAMHPTTWVEVRDRKTFALQSQSRLDNVAVSAATLSGAGVRLAGSVLDPKLCDERAAVFAVDEEGGKATPLYSDGSIGSSSFAAISPTDDGAVCAVGESDYRVDFVAQAINPSAPLTEQQLQRRANERESGLAMCVSPTGKPGFSKYFDAGDDIYLDAIDSSRPKEILIGGSVGSRGVVLHLAMP
jgi:CHAT domain